MATAPAATATAELTEESYLARWMNDPRYCAEQAVSIRVAGNPVPWVWNAAQNTNYTELFREVRPGLWVMRVTDDIEGKGRQRGGSTERIWYLFHAWVFGGDFGPAFVGKTLAFADDTAQKLKLMADLFYESMSETVRKVFCVDPYEIMPKIAVDNVHELRGTRGNSLRFASERTKGQGRAETANAVYITDLSEWTTYKEAIAGYAGSLSQTGREWVHRDFTGKGPGNAAHSEYLRMKAEQERNPGGPTRARFFGRDEIGYPPGHLERQRARIGDDNVFAREFPATEADMFRGDPNARFDPDWIDRAAARNPHYLTDFMTDEEIRASCVPCYCIDSAEGTPAGDYAVIKCRDAKTGLEIMPPWRKQASPDDTAQEMAARHARFPGVINPLRRNHGAAVISRLKVLGLSPWLYRMTDFGNRDGKEGLDENTLTVPQMQTEYEVMLKGALINLPSENGRMEATIFGLQKNGKIEAPPGFHDDELVADMGCVVAFKSAIRRHDSLLRPPAPFVQTSSRPRELS